ncbi:UNVERIFIED_CONTAM: hypothetical protein K2H54_059668 [Gekko kuhli]
MEPVELQTTLCLLAGLLVPCMAFCCLNGLLLLRHQNPPGSGRSSSPRHRPGGWWSQVAGRGHQQLQWQVVPQVGPAQGPAASTSSDLEKWAMLVPPNSPACLLVGRPDKRSPMAAALVLVVSKRSLRVTMGSLKWCLLLLGAILFLLLGRSASE